VVRKLQGAKTRNNKWHLTRILLYHPKGIDQCHIDELPNSLFEEKNWRLYTYHKCNFKNLNLNNYFLSESLAFQSTLKGVRRRSQRGKEKTKRRRIYISIQRNSEQNRSHSWEERTALLPQELRNLHRATIGIWWTSICSKRNITMSTLRPLHFRRSKGYINR